MIECSPLTNKTWQDVELCGFSIDDISAPFVCTTNRNSMCEDNATLSHGVHWEVRPMQNEKCKIQK